MKKLLITLGLSVLTLTSALAQGTINPLNSPITRFKFDSNHDGIIDATDQNFTAAYQVHFGLFWGAAGGPADTFAGEMTIGSTAGVLVGLPSIFALDGAGDVGTIVSLEVRIINNLAWCGRTGVKQVRLADAAGPGTGIWSPSGTGGTFTPFIIHECPEPSTLALGALGVVLSLVGARRRMVK